jgi:hypothetical protein
MPLADPACVLSAGAGLLAGPVRGQVGGHSLGVISGQVESMAVQVGRDGTSATAQFVTEALRLQVELGLPLQVASLPSAPLQDGWIELRAPRLLGCSAGVARVAFRLPESVEPLQPTREAELPLQHLSLVRLPVGAPAPKTVMLKAGAHSPLRLTPAGVQVATVRGPAASFDRLVPTFFEVTELNRKGNEVLVRIEGSEASATGWVSSNLIEKAASVFGMLGALGPADADLLRCSSDVTLLASAQATEWEIGQVRANATVLGRVRPDGGYQVLLREQPFAGIFSARAQPEESVMLTIPAGESSRCTLDKKR